jgi:hypothetical protein
LHRAECDDVITGTVIQMTSLGTGGFVQTLSLSR